MSGIWSPDSLGATPGDDTFSSTVEGALADGLAGDDQLSGLLGDDTLIGNDGNDTLFGEQGSDRLEGGAGDDLLLGGVGDDTMLPGAGADEVNGGISTLEFVSYEDAAGPVGITVQGAQGVLTDGAAAGDTIMGVEGFIGSDFADTLVSGSGGFILLGGGGGDLILGGEQADTLVGGAGFDSIVAGQQGDSLIGGFWNPTTGDVADDFQRDYLIGGAGADTVMGGEGDILFGGAGENDVAYLLGDVGYVPLAQDSIITYPTGEGTTETTDFEIWQSMSDGKRIYLNGFESVSFIGSAICFAAGTRIATARGEVAVEALRVGELVVTLLGSAALQPVQWLGRSRIDIARHPDRARVAPVRISAGALADGVPARDLRVSPDHALYLGGHLVPARLLVNGSSIVQEMQCPIVTYWHVELPAHGLLVSDGAVSESYLDDGNRAQFDNGRITALVKDFEAGRGNGHYATHACRPVIAPGPALDRIRAAIAARGRTQAGRRRGFG